MYSPNHVTWGAHIWLSQQTPIIQGNALSPSRCHRVAEADEDNVGRRVGWGGMSSLSFADKGKDPCPKEKNKQILPCPQVLVFFGKRYHFLFGIIKELFSLLL